MHSHIWLCLVFLKVLWFGPALPESQSESLRDTSMNHHICFLTSSVLSLSFLLLYYLVLVLPPGNFLRLPLRSAPSHPPRSLAKPIFEALSTRHHTNFSYRLHFHLHSNPVHEFLYCMMKELVCTNSVNSTSLQKEGRGWPDPCCLSVSRAHPTLCPPYTVTSGVLSQWAPRSEMQTHHAALGHSLQHLKTPAG